MARQKTSKPGGSPLPPAGAEYLDPVNEKIHELAYYAAIGEFAQKFEQCIFVAKAFIERCFYGWGLKNPQLAICLMADMNASQTIAQLSDIYKLTRPDDKNDIKNMQKLVQEFKNLHENRNTIIHRLAFKLDGAGERSYTQTFHPKKFAKTKQPEFKTHSTKDILSNMNYTHLLQSALWKVAEQIERNKPIGLILQDFNTHPFPKI